MQSLGSSHNPVWLAISLIALLVTYREGFAQDSCNDILVKDLANRSVIQTDQSSLLASQHARCAQSSSSSGRSSGIGVGGSVSGFGLNFNNSNSTSNSQASSDCGSESSDQEASAALYYSQSSFHDVVEAWKQCIESHPQFACWAEKNGDSNHLTIHARWGILSAAPVVTNSNISIGTRPSKPALPVGTRLLLGDNLLFVDRLPNEGVSIGIQASPDRISAQACAVWVPSAEEAARPATVLHMTWATQSPISSLGPPSECSCASINHPQAPLGNPRPPFPAGATEIVTNNCQSDIAAFVSKDTVPQSAFLPTPGPANGRLFGYQTIKPGQRLMVDIAGSVSYILTIPVCPAAQSHPVLGHPGVLLCISSGSPPIACPAQGPPGANCACQVGGISHSGINRVRLQ
jgi:hypothetical protein